VERTGPVDTHNYKKMLQDALENGASSRLASEDKVAVGLFSETLKAQGISLGRVKYTYQLKTLSENLVKLWDTGSLEQADANNLYVALDYSVKRPFSVIALQ